MGDKFVTAVEAANIARSVFEAILKQGNVEKRAVEVVIEFRYHSNQHAELWINGDNYTDIHGHEHITQIFLIFAQLEKLLPITITHNWLNK